MAASGGLPDVRQVDTRAPLRWLAGAWRGLWSAPFPFLIHGLALALLSFSISYVIYTTNAALWTIVLTEGFVFVAPMLAMGPYEGGRLLEAGSKPTLLRITFVRAAIRGDCFYLGLALLMVYFVWARAAQVIYAISTFSYYSTIPALLHFAFGTADGLNMLATGSVVGAVFAYFVFALVVVSAPMLLDRRDNVLVATLVSLKAVSQNPVPLTLWAAILGLFVVISAATGFALFVIVFPWLGLASWRAYRELVPD